MAKHGVQEVQPIVGTCVRLRNAVDLRPHCIVREGECGIVVQSDGDFVDIKLFEHHEGLNIYQNTMWLCPAYDDIGNILEVVGHAASAATPQELHQCSLEHS